MITIRHPVLFALELVSAGGVIVLVLWLWLHRVRISRALERIERLDVDGARQQLHMTAENNDLAHGKQLEVLTRIEKRQKWTQADILVDELLQREAANKAAEALKQEKAERGELKELPTDPPTKETPHDRKS